MKRDMELCRTILEQIEDKFPNYAATVEIEGRTEEEIAYHVILLAEAGFIEADIHLNDLGIPWATPKRMKWPGHEFLDAIRNDSVWKQVKETVKEKGGSIPFEIQIGRAS